MTLDELIDWTEAMRPSAYTGAQKTGWVNDLEAVLWTEIFLQPAGRWRPRRWGRDGGGRLLLPDSWRRLYTAYLGAMTDFANGEYTQYENGMTQFNSYMCQLGAWYADAFDPAGNPARWRRLGLAAYDGLTEKARPVGVLRRGAALLAAEWRIIEPFDGDCVFALRGGDSGIALYQTDIASGEGGARLCLGMIPPGDRDETLSVSCAGGELSGGRAELWVLEQSPARRKT